MESVLGPRGHGDSVEYSWNNLLCQRAFNEGFMCVLTDWNQRGRRLDERSAGLYALTSPRWSNYEVRWLFH